MQETRIQSLSLEDPLEKKILQFSCQGNPRVRHDLVTKPNYQ